MHIPTVQISLYCLVPHCLAEWLWLGIGSGTWGKVSQGTSLHCHIQVMLTRLQLLWYMYMKCQGNRLGVLVLLTLMPPIERMEDAHQHWSASIWALSDTCMWYIMKQLKLQFTGLRLASSLGGRSYVTMCNYSYTQERIRTGDLSKSV